MLSAVIFVNVFFIVLSNCQKWQQERQPAVRIQQGLLAGVAVDTDSKIVNSYLGVPYAAPPVDHLRFSSPARHLGWNGTYDATNFKSRCPQLPLRLSFTNEDCLYLNIWSPSNLGNYAPLPVVVFFEGLDFFQSSSIPISGQDLAAEGIVVVTVNYRLNVFGFFCLGNADSRGNLGLLDQYFALLWIRENIKQFGGDPEKITLFGYSSGAVSVALHMVSPRTAGLFQRAIISSGSVVTPWQINNDPTVASKEIIRLLGCHAYTLDILGCLRAKKVEEILEALQEYSESRNWTDMFLPVVDNFLPENNRYLPVELSRALKEGTFLQVPILTGISKPITYPQLDEWLELASQGYAQLHQYVERAKIPEIIRLYKFHGGSREDIFDLIKWKYATVTQEDVRFLFDQLKELEYDSKIEAPHFLQLSQFATYVQPIFVYYVDDLGIMANTTDHLVASDLLLLFGPDLLKQIGRKGFNTNEMRLGAQLKQMWTNFVIFGNPTPNNVRVKPWTKYTMENPYVEIFETIKSIDVKEETKKRTKRVTFWNDLLPKIAQRRNILSNNIPKEFQNSPDPAAGFRHAMYTLVALVVALMALLVICIILLKKRSKDRERHIHLGY
nr:carboxylesterase [Pharsalia antennata]